MEEQDREEEQRKSSADGTREGTRPQQGGEGATTRFGMEEGDNTDVHATGGPLPEPEDQADEDDR